MVISTQERRATDDAVESRTAGELLVATDASERSDAALRAADSIARRTGQRVALLSVHEPLPMLSPEVQLSYSSIDDDSRSSLRTQILEQCGRLGLADRKWPLEVRSGDPAGTIASVAGSRGASLIIMGLGGHELLDRLVGDELVLRVLRLGAVPVLAVAPDFSGLPGRILAAMDFSASSIRAVSIAARLVRSNGTITLAHAMPRDSERDWIRGANGFSGQVGDAFGDVTSGLRVGARVAVERRVLLGDAASELLGLADSLDPDLIVAGSHGHNFLSRLLLGSVSTQLVRRSRCSVLVAPGSGPGLMDEMPLETVSSDSYAWAERLEEFTRRNAGVRATIEVLDPEIGAQIERRGVPFEGAAFDTRDRRIQLMFGPFGDVRQHFTRTVGGVTSIQILRDHNGRDLVLRVAHGSGQTLVTLER